jgi:endothelin-converting enzyme/putative endopeptidase
MNFNAAFHGRLIVCLSLVTTLACSTASQSGEAPARGILPGNMDRSVNPGDDFFQYTNGAWMKKTEIPADRGSISVDSGLSDISDKRVQDLIQASGSSKMADLYHSYMDEDGIAARGLAPIEPWLKAIAAIKDKQELARALGEGLRSDVDALNNTNFHTPNLFGLWVAGGFTDPDHYSAYLMQGGLQMPDREYYLASSDRMKDIRAKYLTHVAAMLKLGGFSDPDAGAKRIFDLEHAIAEKHLSLADDQDVHQANNTWKKTDFPAKAPGLDWNEYFRAAGLADIQSFIVWQPSAFTAESALVASQPLEAWKDWMAFHLMENYAGVLPKPFGDERFSFTGKTLAGTTEQRPRWQRAIAVVNADLGDMVGEAYAKKYFPPEAKANVQAMVTNIVAAFDKRIDALQWMDPATKAEAKAKLKTLYVGVGYPETWHDYSGYEVKADDAFGNIWRAGLFYLHQDVARIGKTVDRKEWQMTPQTVNAVNLPLQNALNFPAAILQSPYFDAKAPAAANYGAIGATIGHEISHTFDSEGAAFDSKGALRNWWTAADLKHFNESTAALATQYDAYRVFPDLSLNGKQTLAENVADVAGLAASWDAYQTSLGGKTAPQVDGFSGAQQFFIAYGQSWGTKEREATLRRQILTDSHSPAEYRVATVRNVDAWYSAFDIQMGPKRYLAPKDRVNIW